MPKNIRNTSGKALPAPRLPFLENRPDTPAVESEAVPKTSGSELIRKITDQVELIDWLIEQVKAHKPRMIGAGEVSCFDAIAEEYKYGHFPEMIPLTDYLIAVFDNIADQRKIVRCSPSVRYLAAEALGHGIYHQGAGAEYFIPLLLRELKLRNRAIVRRGDGETTFKSTRHFRERFGFRFDVMVKHGEYTELYRREVGEPPG